MKYFLLQKNVLKIVENVLAIVEHVLLIVKNQLRSALKQGGCTGSMHIVYITSLNSIQQNLVQNSCKNKFLASYYHLLAINFTGFYLSFDEMIFIETLKNIWKRGLKYFP